MASKNTGRKKSSKSPNDEIEDASQFVLPSSLQCSHVEFPILITRKDTASWEAIVEESEKNAEDIRTYVESKRPKEPKAPFIRTESDYIQREVFPYLLPALEAALHKAQLWDALKTQKCFFNGIDYIAQELWNRNPRYPSRKDHDLHIFNMPWVIDYLKRNPRPHYPKSWLWTENYAATMIQKTVRQYFVQREAEVQEMREFWEKLDIERMLPDISANPLLAKTFASGILPKPH